MFLGNTQSQLPKVRGEPIKLPLFGRDYSWSIHRMNSVKGFAPPNTQKNAIEVPGLMPDLFELGQIKPCEGGNNTNRNASLMVFRPASQQIASV